MMKCIRCNKQIPNPDHPLNLVCKKCLDENPKLTAKEKSEMNSWDHVDSFFEVYSKMKNGDWCWYKNIGCKYVELRIDMRDGGCIICNSEGRRINPEALAWQYSDETPEPPIYGAQFDRVGENDA
jgi:hypothetical protein